ncbi:hypothetical protein Kpol_370p2 [Vanderwaltozyma polyspora DSM 70294]|uniref:Acireductone dioxygenase n=1 Tax=Vanderwaltozyma polyspora (strain ATCC 22028 / DSM 70294 / BCRC 21397 / CBS 2163 / NBRC 10782 / NRRL Y-8283 / UCD 57-17) TaxID=436907 RepID=A7TSH5_VANPO|nr:uncharacterized protein Kpol_370p2 [Vanderwaltozyma polyspora DSM 70294]EDO14774.1 hypothetical protein Kpol_370p2 [Vanderwaltozyma polyspora DSM 70294]
MVQLYYHDDKDEIDFREPHNSGRNASFKDAERLGVYYKYCETIDQVNELAKERNYKNRDTVNICLESFNNDESAMMDKLNMFYTEHLHEDEEIRYCLDGSGYFDLKTTDDKDWIRVKVDKGDLLIVPAGIYHRFTLTNDNYIEALRLFKDQPKWEAIGRPTADSLPIRKEYISQHQ